jgi:hypothetical protein
MTEDLGKYKIIYLILMGHFNLVFFLVIHIVGSKSDLENQRQVQPEQVRDYVNSLDADYITHEVSAKDDQGILSLYILNFPLFIV